MGEHDGPRADSRQELRGAVGDRLIVHEAFDARVPNTVRYFWASARTPTASPVSPFSISTWDRSAEKPTRRLLRIESVRASGQRTALVDQAEAIGGFRVSLERDLARGEKTWTDVKIAAAVEGFASVAAPTSPASEEAEHERPVYDVAAVVAEARAKLFDTATLRQERAASLPCTQETVTS